MGGNFVSSRAYERQTGDTAAFWEAWETCIEGRDTSAEEHNEGIGESFDFGDAQQMRRRLPRLTALHLGPETRGASVEPHQRRVTGGFPSGA
jgi:hypothetical protein